MTQSETKLTRKQRRHAPAKPCPPKTAELKAEILRLLRERCTITEICARDDMPAISSLFEWRQSEPDFDAAVLAALEQHAEAIISDAMDQNVAASDDFQDQLEAPPIIPGPNGEPVIAPAKADPARAKSADLYLQAAIKYAGAIAPHKYGSLLKVTDAQIGHGVQISITSYATNRSPEGVDSPEDTGGAAPVPRTPGA